MFVLIILLSVMSFFKPGSAAVSCTADTSSFCFVNGQKVLEGESFQISRSSDVTVTDLVMSETEMPVINPSIFTSYPNLSFLSLSRNGIKQLELKSFANSGKLNKLFIDANFLTRIANATFRSCTSLKNLQIWQNQIKIVEINAFQGLTNLLSLSLAMNKIEFLHPKLFQSLPNLQTLLMESNKIKKFSASIFQNNPELRYVNFNNNQLIELSPDLFKSCPQINSIYFSRNYLVIAENYGAQYVDLSYNSLKKLQITPGTYTLHVHDNFLETIECLDDNVNTFTRVYAYNNSLTSFNCISDMKNLTDLDLTLNKFSRPTQDVFTNLSQLKTFALFNQTKFLKTSAKSFAPLIALQSLRVDRLVDYRNLRQLFPNIYMLSLTTRTWNCSYTQQVAKALSRQKIIMNYNNVYDRSICNVKQVM